MRPRQSLVDQFSAFLQLEADRVSGWVSDARLKRSMERCVAAQPAPTGEEFWALYWHRAWRNQPSLLAEGHLSAYVQEACYWAVQHIIRRRDSGQAQIADYFQIAIAELPKILKACDPEQRASLKTYSQVAFGNVIRDALRRQQELDICNDWALLLKLSRKRLFEALTAAGLPTPTITTYLLAWSCFETGYLASKTAKNRQLQRPDAATWAAIADLYNREWQQQQPTAVPENAATLEKWLLYCAKRARVYLYPAVASLNAPKAGYESGEWQDDLPAGTDDSLLSSLIGQEERVHRQEQHQQISTILTTALAKIDAQALEILQLYYRQGLPQREIAQQLGMQQYTVSRRLTKARETLLLALTHWSQETLHISPTSDVVSSISAILEEWLQSYYNSSGNDSGKSL